MAQILLVCGDWFMEKRRWKFVVDNRIDRGSRILHADESTRFSDFVRMVYEDFGFNENKYHIELSYMIGKKLLKGILMDTPPVVVNNTRQLQGFIAMCKSDRVRLSVVINEEAPKAEKEHVREGKPFEERAGDKDDRFDNDHGSDLETKEQDSKTEEDEEFESRFDFCDDPDGANLDDEDFSVYGAPPSVDSPKLPIKKRERKGFSTNRTFENPSFDLSVGERFRKKGDLEQRLKMMAVTQAFDFDVDKSEPTLYIVKCWVNGCSWRVRASTVGAGSEFHIRIYVKEHICSITEHSGRARQATPEILAILYKDYIGVLGPKVVPADVGDALNFRFGVKMDYWKAYKTLRCCRELIIGTPEKGYEDLPKYLHGIRVANPGTYTRLVVDEVQRFKYLFISFAASISGFPFLRKVVVVDGTFLQGKYKGTLLVATSQDGNFQIFPIAFAVVDTENDESWEWFFRQLSVVIPDDEDLAIISDRHKSIGNAIDKVYPCASRGICTYHLYKNSLVKFKGHSAFKLVKKAARCYKISEFETIFAEIEEINVDLHSYLQRADVSMWTRVHFPGNRYNISTTNIVESLNRVLSVSRNLPIVRLVEEIRLILTRWFSDRRIDAKSLKTTLTRGVEKLMESRVAYARNLKVQLIDAHQVQVSSSSSLQIVNLSEKSCSCRRFDVEKLPCAHAIAAAEAKGLSRIKLCDPYYYKEYLCNAYSGSVLPPDKDLPVPVDVGKQVCLPPVYRQPPGRPKKSRMKSALETAMESKRPRKEYTCSKCKQGGHNVATCKAKI